MTERMLTGLMMDDFQLSLTVLVERAEQLSASASGGVSSPRRLARPHHDR